MSVQDRLPCGLADFVGQLTVANQLEDGVSKEVRPRRRHEDPVLPVPDHLLEPADRGRDDGLAARHRLEGEKARRLLDAHDGNRGEGAEPASPALSVNRAVVVHEWGMTDEPWDTLE